MVANNSAEWSHTQRLPKRLDRIFAHAFCGSKCVLTAVPHAIRQRRPAPAVAPRQGARQLAARARLAGALRQDRNGRIRADVTVVRLVVQALAAAAAGNLGRGGGCVDVENWDWSDVGSSRG